MHNNELSRFDPAKYLESAEARAEYLSAALETGDLPFILDAINVVARAEGMGAIAERAGVGRNSLYKALRADANPEFKTILRVVEALGIRLTARPTQAAPENNDDLA